MGDTSKYTPDEGKVLGSGLLEIPTLQSYIRTCVERAGLNVQFREGIPAPCTDKDTIYIPKPSIYITKNDVVKLRHGILHESLHHIKGPEIFAMLEDNALSPMQEGLGTLFNVFEDGRIEREGAQDYIGDKEILIEGKDLFYRSVTKEGFKKLDAPEDKDLTCIATAMGLMCGG